MRIACLKFNYFELKGQNREETAVSKIAKAEYLLCDLGAFSRKVN